jgi:hypothetical protein
MRIGQNPARRSIPAYSAQRLGAASLVYIPMLEGYFAEMLAVLELHLRSLRQNTSEALDLLVLDNGSCAVVQARLVGWQQQGLIDWLVLSRHNLGKTGALNWIIGALPNELVLYSDCDVLFRPGWLEHSLAILEAFPQAGMITAQPDFLPLADGTLRAHLALNPAQYSLGQVVPSQRAVDEYVHGLGEKEKTRERVQGKPIPLALHLASGTQAVIGATHMQFLARRAVLQAALPLPATLGLSPEEDQVLDRRVDEQGFLHLSTLEPYVYHMGNQVDDIATQENVEIPLTPPENVNTEKLAIAQWPWGWRMLAKLARASFLRGFLIKLYNRLFQIYAQ